MTHCANCETNAVTKLTITATPAEGTSTTLPLCQSCYDAFQWGFSHGEDHDSIEESPIEEEE